MYCIFYLLIYLYCVGLLAVCLTRVFLPSSWQLTENMIRSHLIYITLKLQVEDLLAKVCVVSPLGLTAIYWTAGLSLFGCLKIFELDLLVAVKSFKLVKLSGQGHFSDQVFSMRPVWLCWLFKQFCTFLEAGPEVLLAAPFILFGLTA